MTGAGFAIAFAFPFFWLVNTDQPLWAMAALAIAQGGSVGIAFGVQGVLLAELFSTQSRYSGAAISREVAAVVFGGFGPFIARSEEHTSELQSLMRISYDVFCLTTKINTSHYHDNDIRYIT